MASKSPFNQLFELITAPPPNLDPFYNGTEYKWWLLTFRPAEYKTEVYLLFILLLYVALFFVGRSFNLRRVNAWLDAHLHILGEQFSKPTLSGLIVDGYSDFFNFSTGRKGVVSLHTIFQMLPRHDPIQMIINFVRSLYDLNYSPKDKIILDFKLSSSSVPPFVWAVVAKDHLSKVKEGRWDLTFTKVSESSLLGPSYSVLSEFADVTDSLLKSGGSFSLVQALKNAPFKEYFLSLSISDQPLERPASPINQEDKERHVIVTMLIPSVSKMKDTASLMRLAFEFVDALDSKCAFRPETKIKLKKVREDIDEQIKKEVEQEKKEEVENEKQAAKRKLEEERIAKLSANEQRKALERDRKRAMRKTQGKMTRK